MTNKITTRPSTKKYKEGWSKIFGSEKVSREELLRVKTRKKKSNIWKCPACGKEFDYGGKSYCYDTGKNVQMVKVKK